MSFSKAPEFDSPARKLAHLTKALSHPCRLRILKLLSEHDRCPFSLIESRIPLHRSTVSQHLLYLRERHLIDFHTDGKHTWYFMAHGQVGKFIRRILDFLKILDTNPGISGKLGMFEALKICLSTFESCPEFLSPDPKPPP